MKLRLTASVLVMGLMALPALAHDMVNPDGSAHSHVHRQPHGHPDANVIQKTVRVSCFRGPFRVTAWDHPEPQFVDDLVAFGYDYPAAHAIGNRVCKDMTGVGNAAAMKRALLDAIAMTPPGH